MKQLPERDLLSMRLMEGRVTAAQVERLARRLAAFHRAAAIDDQIRSFGEPAVIRANVKENFTQTEPLIDGALPRNHFEAVRGYTRRFLCERADLCRRRMAQDRIRDGHGDLRAQSIYLDDEFCGGAQILDCIEFNERFRYQDVAADLAYLAMDLDLAGRRDLREALVEAYRSVSDDVELLWVLPFYQCYRAYVRGKIALFAAAEPEIPPEQLAAETALAACAFDLALSYTRTGLSPLLVMMGLSGTGKSVLARELARRLPAVLFSSDRVRKDLAGAAPTQPLDDSCYTAGAVGQAYDALRAAASRSLSRGQHTILDATFLDGCERLWTAGVARSAKAPLPIVECCCLEDVAHRRISERGAQRSDPSDATTAIYDLQARSREPLEDSVRPFHLAVDTTLSVREQARAVLLRLDHPNG